MVGYEINFNGRQSDKLLLHPLYLKYASSIFAGIDANAVKIDLAGVMADVNAQEVCTYLAWLIRMKALMA
jgi:hypothetical protein